MSTPIVIVTGQPTALPLQCYLRGSGTVAAAFNASDALTAAVIQRGWVTPLFMPAVAWYTANSTQDGFSEGQVEPSFTTAQAAQLVPSTSYTLCVWRAIASAPSVLELIARVPLVIEALAA